MGRFLRGALLKGMPLNSPGVAQAITAMDEALSRLDCQPGKVRWHGNTPVIYPEKKSAAGALMSHHLRISTVDVEGGEEGETEKQLQVFADGPLWHLGPDVLTAISNELTSGKWRSVERTDEEETEMNGIYWSVVLDDGATVSVFHEDDVPDGYSAARPIGVVADGKIRQLAEGVLDSAAAVLFEAVTEYADYLDCAFVASLDANQHPVPVDPGEEAETLVKVWKPWLLRRTPFHGLTRDDITYTYSSLVMAQRLATWEDPEEVEENITETQRVTPSYSARDTTEGASYAGELIHAIPAGNGEWQDINTAGRCWAAIAE